MPTHKPFGEQLPFCEPYWYQGQPSPYYNEGHVRFRAVMRAFVDREIKPHVDEWIEQGQYPLELHRRAHELGIGGVQYPREWGGECRFGEFDYFYELIKQDELYRAQGRVLRHEAVDSMALPPVAIAAQPALRDRVVPEVVSGRRHIALMISEPYAGSDVAGVRCSARREGDHYIVNGQKKWITGGDRADYYLTVVRTGEGRGSGVSLLLLERSMPGITVRRMKTQFDSTHPTTFVTLRDVRVPAANLIGEENKGFALLARNFNHERWLIAVGACRCARVCFEEALKWCLQRRTFGKLLFEHQSVRAKLSEMARQIESLHDFCERLAYAMTQLQREGDPTGAGADSLGSQCALLKVQASRTFELCAREASQLFGGSSIVKEGKGQTVERLYREVRAQAIPGGSEEILMDFALRQAVRKHQQRSRPPPPAAPRL
eukprot:TRINITY_DN227_c0_g2_i1.p1 TRINITY_DN227_c0_g2~~TRINITY_DN227_c0_g2_i1.p1  ORF type:complete len:433 (+),score=156.87 TRINITY_DN227_c0_g2_i1:88-1386(+)